MGMGMGMGIIMGMAWTQNSKIYLHLMRAVAENWATLGNQDAHCLLIRNGNHHRVFFGKYRQTASTRRHDQQEVGEEHIYCRGWAVGIKKKREIAMSAASAN